MRRRRSKMSFTMFLPTRKTSRISRIMLRLMSTTSTALVPTEPGPGDCGRWNSKTAKRTTASAVATMINPSRRRRRASGVAALAGDESEGPGMGSRDDRGKGRRRQGRAFRRKAAKRLGKMREIRAAPGGGWAAALPPPEEVQDDRQDDAHHDAGDEGEVERERSAADQDVARQAAEPRNARREHEEHADEDSRDAED